MGLSTLRDASASSLTATAPTELASRAASLSRRSTTSSGTLRKYKVRMLQYASSLLAQCLETLPVGCRAYGGLPVVPATCGTPAEVAPKRLKTVRSCIDSSAPANRLFDMMNKFGNSYESQAEGSSVPESHPVVVDSDQATAPSGHGERLVADIAHGDYLAFDEFYALFQSRVFGLAYKLLLDHGQAEEVTQEVFLQLWQQASRFDPARDSAVAWVFRITHARAVDRVRASQRSSVRDSRYVSGIHVIETDVVVEDVLVRADQSMVREALLRLSPIQRESIQLAYFSGMTTQQISEHIGVGRPTVKTRIRDGLKKLAFELSTPASALAAS